MKQTTLRYITIGLISITLAACSSSPTSSSAAAGSSQHDGAPSNIRDINLITDAVPQYEPRSRWGNAAQYRVFGNTYYVMNSAENYDEQGGASWYGTKFHGRRTSSGESYDMWAMTAAHKSLPLPTYVRVTNLDNQKSIVVKVNDRGPFHSERIIDLSYAGALKLDMVQQGTARVQVTALPMPEPSGDTPQIQQYLQVAAYRSAQQAQQLVERLQTTTDYALHITPTNSSNGWYRVVVGPIHDEQSLRSTHRAIAQQEQVEPLVLSSFVP